MVHYNNVNMKFIFILLSLTISITTFSQRRPNFGDVAMKAAAKNISKTVNVRLVAKKEDLKHACKKANNLARFKAAAFCLGKGFNNRYIFEIGCTIINPRNKEINFEIRYNCYSSKTKKRNKSLDKPRY